MDRRTFISRLVTSAALTTAATAPLAGVPLKPGTSDRLGQLLPTRPLGTTGERLTTLCLGGYHSAAGGDKNCQAVVEAALEEGIRFFDTAYKYLGGDSETFYGKHLTPKYRDDVFIMSKADTRDPEIDARTQLETSLKRLNTDYIDLWMVHTLVSEEDAEKRVTEMLEVFQKAKSEGKVRHIGASCHYTSKALLKALDMTREDPLTAALMPMSPVDSVSSDSFINNVLPRLTRQKVAPLAMKTMNAGRITTETFNGKAVVPDRISIEENQWFVLSLPITSWVSGMRTVEEVRTNANILRRFSKLTEEDRLAIANKVMDVADEGSLQPYRNWMT